jgi:hypothetical protein
MVMMFTFFANLSVNSVGKESVEGITKNIAIEWFTDWRI